MVVDLLEVHSLLVAVSLFQFLVSCNYLDTTVQQVPLNQRSNESNCRLIQRGRHLIEQPELGLTNTQPGQSDTSTLSFRQETCRKPFPAGESQVCQYLTGSRVINFNSV